MSTEKKLIPIPADIWDTLEFSALAFGGIGGGLYFEDFALDCPRCIHGHTVAAIEADLNVYVDETTNPLARALLDAIGEDRNIIGENDTAVRAINARKGEPGYARVSWEEYTTEMGWVRGA